MTKYHLVRKIKISGTAAEILNSILKKKIIIINSWFENFWDIYSRHRFKFGHLCGKYKSYP